MIRINITKEELANERTLFDYVEIALKKHFSDFVPAIINKKSYYLGTLPDYDYVINKTKYIVDMATEVFIGTPPDITTYSTSKTEKDRLINLNKRLKLRNFDKALFSVGHNAGNYGSGYLLTYTEVGDDFPRFVSLDPEYTNVVFDCSVSSNSLFGFTIAQQTEYVGNQETTYYKVYIYTDTMFYEARTKTSSDYSIVAVEQAVPHLLGRVAITEFDNNELMRGDAEPVYDLITAYNKLQNDRLQNVEDLVQYVLLLKNVRVGNSEEQEAFVDLLKEHRVLAVEGDGVDAKFLTNPLDQNQLQVLAGDLDMLIHQISRVPNLTSSEFVQSTSEPALKLKLKGYLDLAKEKERSFTPALMRVLKMILAFISRLPSMSKYVFDLEEIDLKYTHTLPSNDQEMITQIMNLKNADLLNPKIALQNISWIENVDAYIEGIEVAETAPVNDGGTNATNIARQNAVPQDTKQMDNLNNFNQGNANKLQE